MSNFIVEDGFDASSSAGSYIPTGAIIMSAKTYSLGETIQSDRCPCDGRSLNTYDYPNLHKVISNNFGGVAYSQGITDNSDPYLSGAGYAFIFDTNGFSYRVDAYSIGGLFNAQSTIVIDPGGTGSVYGIDNNYVYIFRGYSDAFVSSISILLDKKFNVPALMPTSSYTPTGDSSDQIYVAGANNSSNLGPSLTPSYHEHEITGILSPTGVLNNVVDSHTHTVAARNHTTTVNDNNHTFSNPTQNLGNSSGTSQRNDGNTVGAGLAHQHNVNSSTTRATSPGTTAVPNHTHTSYQGTTSTSSAASKPAHSHTAASVSSQLVSNYAGPSYIRVLYYIKL